MVDANQPTSPQDEPKDPVKATFFWGMAPVPLFDLPANFLAIGGTGSGKTISLRMLLQSALAPVGRGLDHRVLIYDTDRTRESVLKGMDPRCPVHVLNPSDPNAVAWDIATDIANPRSAHQLAASLLPRDPPAQPFFVDAARNVLTAVLLGLIKLTPAKWTLNDVLFAVEGRDRLRTFLAQAPEAAAAVQALIAEERVCADLLATIATGLYPLRAVADRWQKAPRKISLGHWLQDEGVLVLAGDPLTQGRATPIVQAILGRLADLCFSSESSAARRTWIFLDDVPRVGRLEALPALLQRGRHKGVCVVLALNAVEALRQLYGEDDAELILASCSHKTALRTDDPETAAWAEQCFGPPLRARDLLTLPRPGPDNGLAGFHQTPERGTYFEHKPWDWVLAQLQPPKSGAPD